ncbi:MAG: isochorismatase family protein, partial [Lachnospiraceae bacterium]|nr:isochorismatase family protein [Lachnospiraceae bacterium]
MKLLIVVDMQNDFVTGSLGTKEAQAIVENVVCKIKETPAEQIYVTQDTHPEQYLQTKEGLHLPVAHCIEGTDGHCLCPAVEQALKEKQVDAARKIQKPTFGSMELIEKLRSDEKIVTDSNLQIELVG